MSRSPVFRAVAHCFRTLSLVVIDLVRLASLAAHSRGAVVAENLFLRKQLALFQEREVKPRRTDDSARWMMATLSRMFPWGNALVNVEAVRSSGGSAKDFGCYGAGSPNQREGLACPRTSGSWSGKWRRITRSGGGTYRQRVETEARDSRIVPYRGEVPARRSGRHVSAWRFAS